MKFTGHERDLNDPAGAGDDLDYMHARHCSPITGRFTSMDPIDSTRLTIPQSWNNYQYAMNSPARYIDPEGRSIWGRVIKIVKVLSHRSNREVIVTTIRGKSKTKSIERTKKALQRIDLRQRAEGTKRVVRTETAEARNALAKQLSPNGKLRGPEKSPGFPEHVHPAGGEFEDVHIETATALVGAAAGLHLLGEIFAPTTQEVSSSGEATPVELLSAAAWDTTSTLDPVGVSDLITYIFLE